MGVIDAVELQECRKDCEARNVEACACIHAAISVDCPLVSLALRVLLLEVILHKVDFALQVKEQLIE